MKQFDLPLAYFLWFNVSIFVIMIFFSMPKASFASPLLTHHVPVVRNADIINFNCKISECGDGNQELHFSTSLRSPIQLNDNYSEEMTHRSDARPPLRTSLVRSDISSEGYFDFTQRILGGKAVFIVPATLVLVVAEATEDSEIALELTRADRRSVQVRLKLLGFDTQGTDGIFGPKSRAALSDWQAAQALPVSGFLNQEQYNKLLAESEELYLEWRRAQPKLRRVKVCKRGAFGSLVDCRFEYR